MRRPEDFHLLIVDDEDGIRKNLAFHFEMDGYKIFTANGGNKALEIVKTNRIDFIISDIRMPDGDGEVLLEKIRELNPELPVIVMVTGFAELTKKQAIDKGALDLLTKPINFDLIEDYIQKTLQSLS